MIVTGIDEAGYGPILGPLVVSAVTFEVPDRLGGDCLWSLLSRCVTQRARPGRSDPRLPVCDSKKLYAGPKKLARLERSALTFLAVAGQEHDDFDQAISNLDESWAEHSREVPWFAPGELRLPLKADAAEIRTQRSAVAGALGELNIRLVGIRAVVLPAREYNRMVRGTRNKAAVLFWATVQLAVKAMSEATETHRVVIDRQGGRTSYALALMKHLDIDTLHVLEENPDASRYTLTHLPVLCEIGFFKGGEDRHFAIALASIISKYVRELCMHRFNLYWCKRIDNLAPTAGYYTDGMRFLRQVRPHFGAMGIEEPSMMRSR